MATATTTPKTAWSNPLPYCSSDSAPQQQQNAVSTKAVPTLPKDAPTSDKPRSPLSIYHAFDMPYSQVAEILPQLQRDGYSHVQLSPAQRSLTTLPPSATVQPSKRGNGQKSQNETSGKFPVPSEGQQQQQPKQGDSSPWWLRYQPTEFTVGNCYGTKAELKALTEKAHGVGLKVISDVCLNFMYERHSSRQWYDAEKRAEQGDRTLLDQYLNELDTEYGPFRREDFRERTRINPQSGREQKMWFMGQLPCLNLGSEKVQQIHFQYLQELVDAGVDGFRYDCAQWFDLEVMDKYLKRFPTLAPEDTYLELIERKSFPRIQGYAELAPVTHYPLGDELCQAFNFADGKPVDGLSRLDGTDRWIEKVHPRSVTFAVNHDTYHSEQSRLHLDFENNQDHSQENLATAVLLAFRNGVPLIFRETASCPFVKAGVTFRRLMTNNSAVARGRLLENMQGKPVTCAYMWERGRQGFLLMNVSSTLVQADVWKIADQRTSLEGTYENVTDKNDKISITADGKMRPVRIPPRSAQFYVLTSKSPMAFVVPSKQKSPDSSVSPTVAHPQKPTFAQSVTNRLGSREYPHLAAPSNQGGSAPVRGGSWAAKV